jgi:hypothetical protein
MVCICSKVSTTGVGAGVSVSVGVIVGVTVSVEEGTGDAVCVGGCAEVTHAPNKNETSRKTITGFNVMIFLLACNVIASRSPCTERRTVRRSNPVFRERDCFVEKSTLFGMPLLSGSATT